MESATPAGEAILWSDFAVKRTLESQQTTLHQAVAVSVIDVKQTKTFSPQLRLF